MGMYVSQLRSVPAGRYDYYLYLVEAPQRNDHSQAVDRFFDTFSKQNEVEAVIVRGPEGLTEELRRFLDTHAGEAFQRLDVLFHRITSLVIVEGALQTTSKPVHLLPLLPQSGDTEDVHGYLDTLLSALLRAMRDQQLTEFVQSLGAERVTLSEINGGLIVATLRRINDVLELKPNVWGLGINLNEIIRATLGAAERSI